MESVQVQITPGGPASRLEVIIRLFYTIIAGIILYVFIMVVYVITAINFWTCLILGKRIGVGFVANVIAQVTKLMAYALYVTDERPPLIPEI